MGPSLLTAVLWGGLAAASLLIGYFLSTRHLSMRTVGLVMGLGAGALIGAIAYELIPETLLVEPGTVLVCALGAVAYFAADWLVDRRGGGSRKGLQAGGPAGSGAAIAIGTLLDAIPESIVLGMGLAFNGVVNLAFLGAVLLSNIPEGIAGSMNLTTAGAPQRRILRMWVMLVMLSAACAGLGYLLAVRLPTTDGHLAQAFAAGAVLTMLSDAMIPEAHEHGGNVVGLFTVLGFLGAAALSLAQ
jgi:zinc transporter, ZIP family